MKKITNLLIVCSLALAGAVLAQQPTPEAQPPGKKPDKKAPAEVKPKAPSAAKADAPAVAPKTEAPVRVPKTEAPARAPKTEAPAVKEPAAAAQPPAAKEPAATKPEKKAPSSRKPAPAATAPETKTEQPAAIAPPADKKQQSAESKKDRKAPAAANTPTTPAPTQAATTPATTKPNVSPAATAASTTAAPTAASTTPPAAASTAPAATAPASAAPSIAQTSPTKPVNPAAPKKLDVQKVEQIRQQHTSFRAEARPDRVPPVTFTANYRIQGSDQWQGPQYEVYRSYRPERRDQAYYRSRYQRVELIAGGYYYFHNNYWYPAWGYNPTNEYYAYDAPIYAGKRALPPDKVIADVQAVLKEMGYYKGEVDGLLGPLTRAALTGYQTDQGMVVTAVIDEPTLDSLGMG
ncbi:MAG TPA: peptidoglycan-binding protein [Chthoniobacterales bacterium]|nr:peptidoglycan-binding protein [Chthoniobacterales bacterium]